MRIAYGVHGYGRGHASRALAILPELKRQHEVLLLAGGDAYDLLKPEHTVVRIPTLRFYYVKKSRFSPFWSALRNFPSLMDIELHGPGLGCVCATLADFAPDVVIADADSWTHRAAKRLKIPRIGFDHFGILAYCKHQVPLWEQAGLWMNSLGYQRMMGQPERVVVSSFYPAEAQRPGVTVVGPLLRAEVLRTRPTDGEHLLVYLNQGRNMFTSRLRRALIEIGIPVKIYGIGERKRDENLIFCPQSNLPFIEDLANCRALLSTAGNQLIGEALHLRKPVLVIPEQSLEQRLNAAAVDRMGIGISVGIGRIGKDVIEKFLALAPQYKDKIQTVVEHGWGDAHDALRKCLHELAGPSLERSDVVERLREEALT
jgi:uncharacterized protein (TIGR00661 family)